MESLFIKLTIIITLFSVPMYLHVCINVEAEWELFMLQHRKSPEMGKFKRKLERKLVIGIVSEWVSEWLWERFKERESKRKSERKKG